MALRISSRPAGGGKSDTKVCRLSSGQPDLFSSSSGRATAAALDRTKHQIQEPVKSYITQGQMDKQEKHTMTCVTWKCIMSTVCYDCSKEQKQESRKLERAWVLVRQAEVGSQHSALKSEGIQAPQQWQSCTGACISAGSDSQPS